MKFDAAKKSPLGTHVMDQQFHDGVPNNHPRRKRLRAGLPFAQQSGPIGE